MTIRDITLINFPKFAVRPQFCSGVRPPLVGLDTAIKPLLSHSTTGEFNFPPKFFTDARKALKMKTVSVKPSISHFTTEEFKSPLTFLRALHVRVEPCRRVSCV